MTLIMRNYQTEEDYWRIRAFLREVFLRNDRRQWSWPVTRFDYWYWHLVKNVGIGNALEDAVFLWETDQGQLVAAITTEDNVVTLQVHPNFHTEELEEDMLTVAEKHFTITTAAGRRRTFVDVHTNDSRRLNILKSRGYIQIENRLEYQWRRYLDAPIPEAPIPKGYTARSLGDIDELPARSWASWRAFHPGEPDEKYTGWEWYKAVQQSPLYRRDLDLVAVAPSGEIAAFATLWYDDVTRTGHFVPVGVIPEHQQHGLDRILITEGLCRLKRMGGVMAIAIGYDAYEAALYSSTLSLEHDISALWGKEW